MNLEEFSKKRILVVGDIMLDKHIKGSVSRISPEAPVPILKVNNESYNPGGAANLANNLAALGARVYLSGIVGSDEAQKILFKELEKKNIDFSLVMIGQKPTIQKIRGMEHQHLFRIDYEDASDISQEEEKQILERIKDKIQKVDAIILSDYNKGTLTKNLVQEIIGLAKEDNKIITADCKPINMEFYKNVDVLKPNKKEAIEMTLARNVKEAGKKLIEKLNSNIIITQGSEGCTLFEKEKSPFHIPTSHKEFYDVSGAGDTFMAALTLAMISNFDLRKATQIANQAASLVVLKPGVALVTREELQKSFQSEIKIVPKAWGQEEWIVNNAKYCGKKMLIKTDFYCSYHMHKIKEETFYVEEGELEVIHNGEYKKIGKSQALHINPGGYHSFRATKDTIFFEFATQHTDEDNYRMTTSSQGDHEKWKREIEEAIKNEQSSLSR